MKSIRSIVAGAFGPITSKLLAFWPGKELSDKGSKPTVHEIPSREIRRNLEMGEAIDEGFKQGLEEGKRTGWPPPFATAEDLEKRRLKYVTVKVPKLPNPLEEVFISSKVVYDPIPEIYRRDPIVPAEVIREIVSSAFRFRDRQAEERRAFYRRKKSQAKNWRKWRG